MPPEFITTNQARARSGAFGDIGGGGSNPSPQVDPNEFSSAAIKGKSEANTIKNTQKILKYPDNVGQTDQAHHVIFSIRHFSPAKIDVQRKKRAQLTSVISGIQGQTTNTASIFAAGADAGGAGIAAKRANQEIENIDKAIAKDDRIRAEGGSLRLASGAKVRIETTIALYMPPSVSTNYAVNYSDQDIGLLAEAGFEAFSAFMRTGGSVESKLKAGVGQGMKALSDKGSKAAMSVLDTVAPGAKALHQKATGTAITPRMELMFESVARRTFTYNFIFIPKSPREARTVQEIVLEFKKAMHPEFKGGNTFRTHEIPNTVDITYLSGTGENGFLNKISTCHITGLEVSYGGDRYVAYEPTEGKFGGGHPPQRTSITLNFTELGILTKEDIRQGF